MGLREILTDIETVNFDGAKGAETGFVGSTTTKEVPNSGSKLRGLGIAGEGGCGICTAEAK